MREMRKTTAVPFLSRHWLLWMLSLTLAGTAALLLIMGAASHVQGRTLPADSATVYVDPVEQSVSRCGTLTVSVKVRDLPRHLSAYEFTLSFDPNVITVTNVVDVRFPGGFVPEPDIGENTVRFVAFILEAGTNDDGVLAVLDMEVVGLGTSDLVLSRVQLSNGDGASIASTVEHGAAQGTKEALGFAFDPIPSPQVAGHPFPVLVTALNDDGGRAVGFANTASLADSTGTLSPANVTFAAGQAAFNATITAVAPDVALTAAGTNACGQPIQGQSGSFSVTEPWTVFLPIVTKGR